jgi:hypothetical protein
MAEMNECVQRIEWLVVQDESKGIKPVRPALQRIRKRREDK